MEGEPRHCRATVDQPHLLSLYQGTPLVFKPFGRNDLGRRRSLSFMIHQLWCLRWWGDGGMDA